MNEEKITEVPKKKGKASIIIILIGLILIGTGLFLFFGTDLFKKENKDNNKEKEPVSEVTAADKFEGIYTAENDKMYVYKTGKNEIHYMIGDSFEGVAEVNGETAKESYLFNEGEYFEFKIVEGGIELSYHSDEGKEVAIDLGKYTKTADYSKENVYKEAVGDPALLNSKYSGIYKKGNISLYLYQTNEKEVKIEANGDLSFSETFDIISDNKLGAKDFFDPEVNAFEITLGDKEFTLTVNEDVFGFDKEDKEFAGAYTFDSNITQDIVMNEFYKGY